MNSEISDKAGGGGRGEELQTTLEAVQEEVQQIHREIRSAIVNLAPPILETVDPTTGKVTHTIHDDPNAEEGSQITLDQFGKGIEGLGELYRKLRALTETINNLSAGGRN